MEKSSILNLSLSIVFFFLMMYPNFNFSQNQTFIEFKKNNEMKTITVFYYTYNVLYATIFTSLLTIFYEVVKTMRENSIEKLKKQRNTELKNSKETKNKNKVFVENLKTEKIDTSYVYENDDLSKMTIILDKCKLGYVCSVYLTFSFNMILMLIFWPLYFIKPLLVKGKKSLMPEHLTPIFTELCEHLVPFLYSFLQLTYLKFCVNKEKISKILIRTIIYVFAIYIYITFIVCKAVEDKYPYGFMNNMSWYLVVLFVFGSGLAADIICMISMRLTKNRTIVHENTQTYETYE